MSTSSQTITPGAGSALQLTTSRPRRRADAAIRPGPKRAPKCHPRMLNLEAVLGEALSVPMVRFGERLHECELAVEHDLLIQTEPDAWCEVVSNLIAHSAQYGFKDMPAGGCVAISAERLGADRARISYRDDGCGIPALARADVFEPGAGLGLAIVRDIVRNRLQGTIALVDTARGCEFAIEIPLKLIGHTGQQRLLNRPSSAP